MTALDPALPLGGRGVDVPPHPAMAAPLATLGIVAARAALVSPLGRDKGRRAAWRIEDPSGRVVKVRLYESAAAAARVAGLRSGLEPAFAPVLLCDGPVLVEEWIEGRSLVEADEDAAAAWAGALLGRLHRLPLPSGEAARLPVAPWVERTGANLGLLLEEGLLDRTEAAGLEARLRALDPRESRTVLAHLDLCAENIILDRRGELRVVDNEMLEIRPPGFDLARTFHLWSMPAARRRLFEAAYADAAGTPAEDRDFWRIVAIAMGARIFLGRSASRRDACLALLRRFLEAGDFEAAR